MLVTLSTSTTSSRAVLQGHFLHHCSGQVWQGGHCHPKANAANAKAEGTEDEEMHWHRHNNTEQQHGKMTQTEFA